MARSWKAGLGLATASVGFLAWAAGFVGWRASRAIRKANEEVQTERGLRFVVRPLANPQDVPFEAVSAPTVFFQAARFQEHLYIASPAGLLEYDSAGTA